MPFTLDPNVKANKFVHLTNVSINKHNQSSELNDQDSGYGGTKVSLQNLKEKVEAAYKINWET